MIELHELTPTKRALLLHRLEVPEAIADSLTGEWNPMDSEWAEVERVATDLWRALRDHNGTVWDAIQRTERPELIRNILVDCVDGSTYFTDWEDAVASGEYSRSTARRHMKQAEELADLISERFGTRVHFPEL